MSKFVARLLSFAILPAALVALGGADPARAQVVVTKDLCGQAISNGGCVIGNGSALPVVQPNTPVFYTFTLSSPTAESVFIEEAFQQGFVPQWTTCGPALPALSSPMYFGPVSLPANTQVTCTISGYFKLSAGDAEQRQQLGEGVPRRRR
jgi:hypothetical protein